MSNKTELNFVEKVKPSACGVGAGIETMAQARARIQAVIERGEELSPPDCKKARAVSGRRLQLAMRSQYRNGCYNIRDALPSGAAVDGGRRSAESVMRLT